MDSEKDLIFNQCSICCLNYKRDNKPIILSNCGHTFCNNCLIKILNKDRKEIICPLCKVKTNVPNNDLNLLNPNRSILDYIEMKEQQKIKNEEQLDENKKKSIIDNQKIYEKFCEEYNLMSNEIEKVYEKIQNSKLIVQRNEAIKKLEEIFDSYIKIIENYKEKMNKKINDAFISIDIIEDSLKSYQLLKKKRKKYERIFESDNFELLKDKLKSNLDLYTIDIEYDTTSMKFIKETIEKLNSKIYDPTPNLFINSFQQNDLSKELEKLLIKTCDFDDDINNFGINNINKNDSNIIKKEIEKACLDNNPKKIKYIFSHFKLNPNFFIDEQKRVNGYNQNTYECLFTYLSKLNSSNLSEILKYLIDEYDYYPFNYSNMRNNQYDISQSYGLSIRKNIIK